MTGNAPNRVFGSFSRCIAAVSFLFAVLLAFAMTTAGTVGVAFAADQDEEPPASEPDEPEGGDDAGKTTSYTVEHLLQSVDGGSYSVGKTETFSNVPLGTQVTASPKSFTGFTHDGTVPGTTIDKDGITLKLYYARNDYTVSYGYTGDLPDNPPSVPGPVSYKYQAQVSVASAPSLEGYEFSGWSRSGSFEMPAQNVQITGSFTKVASPPSGSSANDSDEDPSSGSAASSSAAASSGASSPGSAASSSAADPSTTGSSSAAAPSGAAASSGSAPSSSADANSSAAPSSGSAASSGSASPSSPSKGSGTASLSAPGEAPAEVSGSASAPSAVPSTPKTSSADVPDKPSASLKSAASPPLSAPSNKEAPSVNEDDPPADKGLLPPYVVPAALFIVVLAVIALLVVRKKNQDEDE